MSLSLARFIIVLFFLSLTTSVLNQKSLEDSTNLISNIIGAFQTKESMNITHFLSSFDIPSCFRRCMPNLDSINKLFHNNKTNTKAMKSLCSNLINSTKCATTAGCSEAFMETMNNAFQFMCIENIDQVSKHFACIQHATGDIQQDCENECGVQAQILENASKKNANELLNLNNMCNSTTCLVKCYRDTLVKRCKIGETNLLDSIFSQVLNGEKNGFEQIMGWVNPNGCNSKDLSLKIPKKISVPKSKNVGKSVEKKPELVVPTDTKIELLNDAQLTPQTMKEANENSTFNPVETALLIDGEVRTLQCQMLDWQKNRVETPDFVSLARLMSAQLIPYTFPKKNVTNLAKNTNETKPKGNSVAAEKEPKWRGTPADQVIPTKSGNFASFIISTFVVFMFRAI